MVYNLRMFVGTYKNKKIEKTIGSKRSRVGTNRRWLKMTQTDKEKLEEALRLIEKLSIHKKFLHGLPFKDLEEIKKILES